MSGDGIEGWGNLQKKKGNWGCLGLKMGLLPAPSLGVGSANSEAE